MSKSPKKSLLSLPLKVILTEEGASYFIQNKKKLSRMRLADNIEEYGVSLNNFSPQTIQHMILVGYISKLEISVPEFASCRQDVLDLSKLIVFSLLYKQFDRAVFSSLIETECVRKHNRTNPSQLIDKRDSVSDQQINFFLRGKDNVVAEAKKALLEPLWCSFVNGKELTIEEQNICMLMTEKFLTRMSRINWYIVIKFFKEKGGEEIINCIHGLLKDYVEKSKVAEYISVMVMELALNSETANMKKEVKRIYRTHPDPESLIFDPEVRKKVIAEMEKLHDVVSISWRLGGGSSSIGKQGRLQITLYSREDEFQEVKESIETKRSADLRKRSLIDFYKELPEGDEGVDLGLYYLSYLDEECKKINVKFESLVNQYSASDLMVITLVFNF